MEHEVQFCLLAGLGHAGFSRGFKIQNRRYRSKKYLTVRLDAGECDVTLSKKSDF